MVYNWPTDYERVMTDVSFEWRGLLVDDGKSSGAEEFGFRRVWRVVAPACVRAFRGLCRAARIKRDSKPSGYPQAAGIASQRSG